MSDLILPKVYTIPLGVPFLHTLARGLWDDYKDDLLALSDVQIYLPNRRSCRAMAEVFLEISDGQATILPRLTPLGDIDEEDILSTDPFGLDDDPLTVPAIAPLERQLILSEILLAREDLALTAADAFSMAGQLGKLIDDAHTDDVDLNQVADLVIGDLAVHWQVTRQFLAILTENWPKILQELGRTDPAQRRNVMLQKKAQALLAQRPTTRIIAAGSTGSIPATAELLNVIARMPNGCVILPGLDPAIDNDVWDNIGPEHPFYYQKRLIGVFAIDRKQVKLWPSVRKNADEEYHRVEKQKLVSKALQPEENFDLTTVLVDRSKLRGLAFMAADTPAQEAKMISLILRDVLNTEGKTAMVVTADRDLARRLQLAMQRWDVEINDSGGEPLSRKLIGTFLRLIPEIGLATLSSATCLSLLRHPFTTFNRSPEQLLEEITQLELAFRNSDEPYENIIAFQDYHPSEFLGEFLALFEPMFSDEPLLLEEWLTHHIRIAEALSIRPDQPNSLWAGEENAEAAQLFSALLASSSAKKIRMSAFDYSVFIGSVLSSVTIRPRFGAHPRLRILSPIEARLQESDVVILAGTNDSVWPDNPQPNPWLSRGMMKDLGFADSEKYIGQAALDFVGLFCMKDVIVTWSRERDGVPEQPSRWLQQIFAILQKNDALDGLEPTDFQQWARLWDEPETIKPQQAPAPAPPLAARPTQLWVSDIQDLQYDPYKVYAKRVLGLRPMNDLDRGIAARDWGQAAHSVLEEFFRRSGHMKPKPEKTLAECVDYVISAYGLSPTQQVNWRQRLEIIGDWLLENLPSPSTKVITETTQSAIVNDIEILGRADRIDVTKDSVVISDYKTGRLPSDRDVASGLAPQLPILGLLARNKMKFTQPIELAYLALQGRSRNSVEEKRLKNPEELMKDNLDALLALIDTFYTDLAPYTAETADASGYDDYYHLKRTAEWSDTTEPAHGSDEP